VTPTFFYQPLKFRRFHQHSLPNLHSSDLSFPDVLPDRPMTQSNGIRSLADTHQKLLHVCEIPFISRFSLTGKYRLGYSGVVLHY
jgi:hypothetical protein